VERPLARLDTPDDDFMVAARRVMIPYLELLGFRVVKRAKKLLAFESAALEIRVFQGKRSTVVGLEIARGDVHVTLDDLLAAANTRNPGLSGADSDVLTKRLAWLRDFLHDNYEPLLAGSQEAFDRVAAVARPVDSNVYEIAIGPWVAIATDAYRRGDYDEVVRVLAPLEDRLYQVDREKLKHARERSSRKPPS
jgi:hypothetical protein